MRLVYKDTQEEVVIGDQHTLRDGDVVQVTYFRTPHKPASEGKVSVAALDGTGGTREYYVGVIGAQWIEREDRV